MESSDSLPGGLVLIFVVALAEVLRRRWLGNVAKKKEAEIEELCRLHYEEFIVAVDELRGVLVDAEELKSEEVGANLLSKLDHLVESYAIKNNVTEAIKMSKTSVQVLELCSKCNSHVFEGRFYPALKIIELIEKNYLSNIPANKAKVPVAVAFNLFDRFKGASGRHLGFMLRGLKQLQPSIEESLRIPFFLFQGDAIETIPKFLEECGASLLVTDFTPLREIRKYKEEICKRVSEVVSIHEVDAHNVVPVWEASDKLEYSAKTLRSKINKLLPRYLIEFPTLQPPHERWPYSAPSIDWNNLIEDNVR
ncbi:hypothetical protein Dimus_000199 [Dionaea muscipula]